MRGAWLLSVDEVAIIRRVGEVVWSVASTSALLIHFAPTRPVCDRASLSRITAWAFLVLMVPLERIIILSRADVQSSLPTCSLVREPTAVISMHMLTSSDYSAL